MGKMGQFCLSEQSLSESEIADADRRYVLERQTAVSGRANRFDSFLSTRITECRTASLRNARPTQKGRGNNGPSATAVAACHAGSVRRLLEEHLAAHLSPEERPRRARRVHRGVHLAAG